MKSIAKISLIFLVSFSWLGCKEKVYVDPIENINKGSITILCDKDFTYVMQQQKEVYESLYPGSTIQFDYMSDQEVIQALYARKAQAAVLGRMLTTKEREDLLKIDTIIAREHPAANDAMAVVVGKNNLLKKIPYQEFIAAIKNPSSAYQFVFESKQSGLIKAFDLFTNQLSTQHLSALDSLEALVDYINKNDKAIGLISYARVSDEDNVATQNLLKKVNILRLEKTDSIGKTYTVSASEADIATGEYPFIRPINYILLNPKERIGIGFANHLYRTSGAKLFLKNGLIPSRMPERDFIINSNGIDITKN